MRSLTAAADQFIVQRGSFKTIVAGYHWFTDWGRDTMIALPGLTLVTGRFDIARQILRDLLPKCRSGPACPTVFPMPAKRREYNTADATLWFFEAIRAYSHYSGDENFVRQQLVSSAERHHRLARARDPLWHSCRFGWPAWPAANQGFS